MAPRPAINLGDGDTVPDRAYVVFKAAGWDDPRDVSWSPPGQVLMYQGYFRATGRYLGQIPYDFFMNWSTPLVADTLGFLVGPFDYMVADARHRRARPS